MHCFYLSTDLGFSSNNTRTQRLYVHSKLYYGIRCRKPSQCKWPAQYYTVEKKKQKVIFNPQKKIRKKNLLLLLPLSLYYPLLGFYYKNPTPLQPSVHIQPSILHSSQCIITWFYSHLGADYTNMKVGKRLQIDRFYIYTDPSVVLSEESRGGSHAWRENGKVEGGVGAENGKWKSIIYTHTHTDCLLPWLSAWLVIRVISTPQSPKTAQNNPQKLAESQLTL